MTPRDSAPLTLDSTRCCSSWRRVLMLAGAAILLIPAFSYAQAGGSPWENAVTVLMTSFTGPIARGLSLVSIVVGGITFEILEATPRRVRWVRVRSSDAAPEERSTVSP